MGDLIKINDVFNNTNDLIYLPSVGIHPCKVNMYNEHIHNCAKTFFKILDDCNLEYYVFAGSSVGYVRNECNIPWVDDYDIIIFKEEINKWLTVVVPILDQHGFNPFPGFDAKPGVYFVFTYRNKHNEHESYFQCDIFYTYIDENNNIKNMIEFGLYHQKNVPYDYVYPPIRRIFHNDLFLPFFNKLEHDVVLEYGDVINNCLIHINHGNAGIISIQSHWKTVYDKFNEIKERAIDRTKKLVLTNSHYDGSEKIKLDGTLIFSDDLEILKYISLNNIGTIFIYNYTHYIYHLCSIKYYFPNIKIHLYITQGVFDKSIVLHLNYVDKVIIKEMGVLDQYKNLVYVNKPIFKLCRVITFGTFDLFHVGHDNIFKNAARLGKILIVGVSSDELNIQKGKFAHENLETRLEKVKQHQLVTETFIEESLEEKNNYIKQYDADILVMGDDWKDKFDWVSCMTIYFPRTPGISSTLLRSLIKQ